MLQGIAIDKHTEDLISSGLQKVLKYITLESLESTVCNAFFFFCRGLISLDFSCLKGKNLFFGSVQKELI